MLRRDGPVLHRVVTSFWDYVEKMDDRSMRCKFCGHLFAKGTPITRIKYHLSGRKRGGAEICAQVPQHVQDAALAAIDGPPAKKPKPLGGSSNNEVTNAISASAQQQNDEMMTASSTAEHRSRPGDKMVRSNDTFGNHVEDMNGAAIDGPPGRKRKTVAGSRNNEATIGIDVHTNDRENGTGEVAEKLLDAAESSRPGEKSGWALLMTNLILEIASAVFDQLGYALIGMVLAFVALLLATAELVHMARKEIMSLLPISHRSSTCPSAPGKPGGTIVEYFGLVGAVWQCFYSTVEYAYARQKKDNPIKILQNVPSRMMWPMVLLLHAAEILLLSC